VFSREVVLPTCGKGAGPSGPPGPFPAPFRPPPEGSAPPGALPGQVRGQGRGGDPDGIADPDVQELAPVAQAVHRVPAHAQPLRHLNGGEQPPRAAVHHPQRGGARGWTMDHGWTKRLGKAAHGMERLDASPGAAQRGNEGLRTVGSRGQIRMPTSNPKVGGSIPSGRARSSQRQC